MGSILFIIGIIIIFFLFNLRGRVKKLEQIVKSNVVEARPDLSDKVIQSQKMTQQPPVPVELLDYTKEQFGKSVSREETKKALLAYGWALSDVDNALNLIYTSTTDSAMISPPELTGPTIFERFFSWLKEDWLMKIGAILLLIGFGWLTTYAFLNNWIGPMGRIALGIVAGVIFIILGWWRIKKYLHQGGVFLVLGSSTVLLTIFAAREIYDFFTPFSALVVMFLSTAFVALVSVQYNNRALALASLILAGVAPLLTSAPLPNYVGLFSYLFVVILGAIWIVVITGRRELTTVALIIIMFYSLPHLFSLISADKGVLLMFAYAFAAVFFFTNTVGILKLKGKEIIPDLITAAGNGLLLLAWIMVAAEDEWKSLIITAWMVVFVVGAFMIYRITQRREPFYVYAGVGVAMLAAATSAELDGATLTIAYTVESGIIALVVYMVLRDIKIAERLSLLLVGPVLLSFESMISRAWTTNIIHKDFFVLLVLSLTLLGLGLFLLKGVKEAGNKDNGKFSAVLLIGGSVYAYILLWLSLHAGLENNNTAVMLSLVVYTIIGLVCYFYGLANEKRALSLYGGALVGFVVGRLILVDVWKMEIAGRIITFFLIGAMLVSTAFLGRKKHEKEKEIVSK